MRLPGYYTTRGDWFMAVAKGSQSLRVAYDALDILCSSRGSFDRLQRGIGLPVRQMPEQDHIRTALATIHGPSGFPTMTYKNLRLLGADGEDLKWLFRSRFANYHCYATVFRKWVYRVLLEYVSKRASRAGTWVNSFEAYDGGLDVREEFKDFQLNHRYRLIGLLRDAEPAPPG
jgi:hypothetical protein